LNLMARLPFPVLLVIKNTLGAINHSLLSLAALREGGLKVAGLIINQTTPATAERQMILDDNLTAIPAMGHTPLLSALPYFEWPDQRHGPEWGQAPSKVVMTGAHRPGTDFSRHQPYPASAGWEEVTEQLGPAAEHLLNHN
jgi:Dethiobiotin synthetase